MALFPKVEVFPNRELCLYFLFYPLVFAIGILKPIFLIDLLVKIPFYNEIFEFLIPLGLLLNF